MNTKSKIALILLAAGNSSRMGTPKQLLKWGENTLLEHCMNKTLSTTADEVYVLLGANYQEIKTKINLNKVNCIINSNWQQGLGNSIAFATQQLMEKEVSGLLFVLADQPTVTIEYLNQLIENFVANRSQIIASEYRSSVGVPVLFDKCYFQELSQLKNDNGAKKIIEKHQKNVIKITPNFKLIDIDTPDTYHQFYHEKHTTC